MTETIEPSYGFCPYCHARLTKPHILFCNEKCAKRYYDK